MTDSVRANDIFSIAILVTVRSSTLNAEYPIVINTIDAEAARGLLAALARGQFDDTPEMLLARCGADNLRALANDWQFVPASAAAPALLANLRATLARTALQADDRDLLSAFASDDDGAGEA